jgi:hypothetical protein
MTTKDIIKLTLIFSSFYILLYLIFIPDSKPTRKYKIELQNGNTIYCDVVTEASCGYYLDNCSDNQTHLCTTNFRYIHDTKNSRIEK